MHLLEEKIFANALNQIPEIGPVRLAQLVAYFGSFQKAWAASDAKFAQFLPEKSIDRIITNKAKINPEQTFAELARRQIEVLLTADPEYPELLREIPAAPPILYVRGKTSV